MFVHGPGGIGKTTLLDAMARVTRGGGRQVTYLDARDVECSPAAALAAVHERTVDDPAAVLPVDGYELLAPLDGWFRTQFLPARPAGALTVVAGREAPAAAWWLDQGWRRLVSVHRLDELDDADSRDLLLGLGVTDQVSRLAQLGRGYPLAPAMLAEVDRSGRRPDQLSDVPDAVGQLCALILDDVPDEAHRTGLATCAHATRTTQDLLTRMIGPRAPEVWAVARVAAVRPAGSPRAVRARRRTGAVLSRAGTPLTGRVGPAAPSGPGLLPGSDGRRERTASRSGRRRGTAAAPQDTTGGPDLVAPGPRTAEPAACRAGRARGDRDPDRGQRGTGIGGPGTALARGPTPQRLPRSSRYRDGGLRAPGIPAGAGRPDGRRPGRGGHLAARVGARPAASR